MVNNHEIIIYKTAHKKGRRHDYDIYKKNHPQIPKQVVNVFDLGYLGVKKDFPQQLSTLPYRKKRKLQLSAEEEEEEEKEYNKMHSKKRIVMEHTIYRLKIQDNDLYI